MPKNFIKTKVDTRVAVAVVLIAIAIGVSASIATLIPSFGSGKFYGSATGTIVLPPPCPDKYYQCPDSGGSDAVCCISGQESCELKEIILKDDVYYCKPIKCSDPKKPKLCTGKTYDTCCATTDSCDESGLGVAYCKPAGCENPNCGSICCDTDGADNKAGTEEVPGDDNECITKLGFPPTCQPKTSSSCDTDGADNTPGTPDDQQFCQGTGKYKERKRCCPAGTCFIMPNGYPQCNTQ